MTTRYTDAWAREQTQWYGDYDRFTVSGPTDPEHGDKSEAPMPLMMDAPTLQSGGEIFTDTIWENYEHLPPATPIDTTPVQGQGNPAETGHGYGGIFRPGASEAELGAARGRSDGAEKRGTSNPPVYRFFNEHFFGFFTKGFEPPPLAEMGINNPVFVRGINSFDVNNGPSSRPTAWTVNPDGSWKRGDYEGSNVNRDFTPPNRTHGEVKYVEPDIVTIIGDAPPPPKSDTYASPFRSMQKFLPTRRRVRGIRRDPGPWDEDMQAADTVPTGFAYGVDGMVVQ